MTGGISEDDRIALNALVDGELDAAALALLEARLASDAVLRAARDEILATSAAVTRLPKPPLPGGFRDRILALTSVPARPARHWRASWRSIAATAVITALITSSGMWLLLASPRNLSLETLVASAHQRSLLAASPVDVLSSDRHTVKPWLDARLGVSPPAPDLAANGYPLFGGRVEVLGQRAVPVLIYRHNEHTISLIAVPSNGGSSPVRDVASGGFNMIEWTGAGFGFVAVSDLEPAELAAFVQHYQVASPG